MKIKRHPASAAPLSPALQRTRTGKGRTAFNAPHDSVNTLKTVSIPKLGVRRARKHLQDSHVPDLSSARRNDPAVMIRILNRDLPTMNWGDAPPLSRATLPPNLVSLQQYNILSGRSKRQASSVMGRIPELHTLLNIDGAIVMHLVDRSAPWGKCDTRIVTWSGYEHMQRAQLISNLSHEELTSMGERCGNRTLIRIGEALAYAYDGGALNLAWYQDFGLSSAEVLTQIEEQQLHAPATKLVALHGGQYLLAAHAEGLSPAGLRIAALAERLAINRTGQQLGNASADPKRYKNAQVNNGEDPRMITVEAWAERHNVGIENARRLTREARLPHILKLVSNNSKVLLVPAEAKVTAPGVTGTIETIECVTANEWLRREGHPITENWRMALRAALEQRNLHLASRLYIPTHLTSETLELEPPRRINKQVKRITEALSISPEILNELPERIQDIVQRRAAGETLQEIAISHGVSRERVRQLEKSAQKMVKLEPGAVLPTDQVHLIIDAYATLSRTHPELLHGLKPTQARYLQLTAEQRTLNPQKRRFQEDLLSTLRRRADLLNLQAEHPTRTAPAAAPAPIPATQPILAPTQTEWNHWINLSDQHPALLTDLEPDLQLTLRSRQLPPDPATGSRWTDTLIWQACLRGLPLPD